MSSAETHGLSLRLQAPRGYAQRLQSSSIISTILLILIDLVVIGCAPCHYNPVLLQCSTYLSARRVG